MSATHARYTLVEIHLGLQDQIPTGPRLGPERIPDNARPRSFAESGACQMPLNVWAGEVIRRWKERLVLGIVHTVTNSRRHVQIYHDAPTRRRLSRAAVQPFEHSTSLTCAFPEPISCLEASSTVIWHCSPVILGSISSCACNVP